MTPANIIRELERLPLPDKLFVIERTLKSIRTEKEKSLKVAVESLYDDYKSDKELTVLPNLTRNFFMKQGESWLVSLDPTVGADIKKTRPAIIGNDNTLGRLPLKVIVPVTDWKDRYSIASWMVKIVPD